MTTIAEALRAIRTDNIVGRGTCSMVDEAMSDAEVIAEFIIGANGKPATPNSAVRKARAAHRIWIEQHLATEPDFDALSEAIAAQRGPTCNWLVEVRNAPQPPADLPDDCYDAWAEQAADIVAEQPWIVVECGAPVHEIADGWTCEAGHRHVRYGSPSQIAEEREEAWAELHGYAY